MTQQFQEIICCKRDCDLVPIMFWTEFDPMPMSRLPGVSLHWLADSVAPHKSLIYQGGGGGDDGCDHSGNAGFVGRW